MTVSNSQMTEWLEEAATLGRDAGISAASWVTDGNLPTEHYVRLARMMADGDPEMDDYLPARPDLSGEWADGPTPNSLAADITGEAWAEVEGETIDAICEAWEQACDEAFELECERLVREAIS